MTRKPEGRFFRDLDGRDDGMFMGKAASQPVPIVNASGGKGDKSDQSSKLNVGATGAPVGGSGFGGQGMGGGMYGTGKGVAKKAGAAPSDWDADTSLPTGFHRPASEQPNELESGGERFHDTSDGTVAQPSNRHRHGLVEGGAMTMRATSSSQMGKHASAPRFLGTSYGIEKSAFASGPEPGKAKGSEWVGRRADEFTGSLRNAAGGVGDFLDSGVKAVTRSPVGATLATLLAARMGLGGIKRIGRLAKGKPPTPPPSAASGFVGKLRAAAGRAVLNARNFVTK